MSKGTNLRLGAAVGAMALAGLAFASPGLAGAPDGHSGNGDDGRKVEKIIIIGDHDGGAQTGGPGEVRTFQLHRMDMADCRGGDRTVRESNENGQRTKVIICRRDGPHPGARAEGRPRVRTFVMNGGQMADCRGGDRTVRESSEDGRRTKVIICRRGDGPHPGARVEGHPRVRAFAMNGGELADCLGGERSTRESNEGGQHKEVVICRRGDGPHAGPGGPPRIRAFSMNGGDLADCLGGERNVTESNENGQRSKVILCTRGDGNPGQRVERLEQVLGRLTSSDQLTPEQKERVTAALREAIERLRTTP